MGMNTIEITSKNLNEIIHNKDNKLVIINFHASWCGPCKIMDPIIEEIAEEYKDKVIVGNVDIEEDKTLAPFYNIKSIPAVVFIENGDVVDMVIGATAKDIIYNKIDSILVN